MSEIWVLDESEVMGREARQQFSQEQNLSTPYEEVMLAAPEALPFLIRGCEVLKRA